MWPLSSFSYGPFADVVLYLGSHVNVGVWDVNIVIRTLKSKNKSRLSGAYIQEITIMQVACIKREHCSHNQRCGGAIPHIPDPSECGKCPVDETATCEFVLAITTECTKCGSSYNLALGDIWKWCEFCGQRVVANKV